MPKKRDLPAHIRARIEEVKAKPVPDLLAGARGIRRKVHRLEKVTPAQRAFADLALRREDAVEGDAS